MENYREAAIRHLTDSEKLLAGSSADNAGHLIGFAAECAIKYKIELSQGSDNPKLHFPGIILAAKKRLRGRGDKAIFEILSRKDEILKGWDVNHRYHPDGTIEQEVVKKWISETKRLFGAAGIKR